MQPVPVQTEEGASRCVCAESGDISALAALPWDPMPSAGEGPSTIIEPVCTAGALLLLLLLLKSHNGWTPAGKGPSITTNSPTAARMTKTRNSTRAWLRT